MPNLSISRNRFAQETIGHFHRCMVAVASGQNFSQYHPDLLKCFRRTSGFFNNKANILKHFRP